VDDAPINIEILHGLLRSEYQLSAATSGAEALELACSVNKPDLILLDITMPGMDGYEVCRRLKSNKETERIPVIFVTALAEATDETHGFSLGAVDYITKPVNSAKLLARVKTHLKLNKAQDELEKQNEILRENLELREDIERITHHDLRNQLLCAISYPTMLMKQENITLKQRQMLRSIKNAALKINQILNGSLNLYKMEKNIYKLEPIDIDIILVLHQIKNEASALLHVNSSSINVQICGKPVEISDYCTVSGEELLFYSLFDNLIRNAIEASPDNEDIHISIDNQSVPLKVQIHNSGAVPLELRDKFFEKYATAGKKDGTGLGTYSAWLMARTLGGDIKMETSDESGTTITLLLPN
jgi:CheY-like chemotaxis protein